MGFETVALGVNPAPTAGVQLNRTAILGQTTPTAIKLGQGNIHGIYAMVSGVAATSGVFIQYFDHGGVTLGVSTPTFEVMVPAAMATLLATSGNWNFPIPVPFAGTATTSGIWVAAGIAASTGTNVAAGSVIVHTLYS